VVADGVSWVVSAQRLAERAWLWLDAAQDEFTLPPEVAADQLDHTRHLKPISELALAGSITAREATTGRHAARVAPALVKYGWRQFGAGELLYELQRENPLETFPLESYAIFVRGGYRHRRLEALLRHLAGLRATRVPELVPNRILGVVNAQRLVGVPTLGNTENLAARTWLGATPEPWASDLMTLYSMTHTVFHVTDWGAHPAALPSNLQDYLHAWLPAWLEVYLEAGHWDVVAEMLMVDLCLTEPAYPAPAWERLADAQQPDGMLPAQPGRNANNPATVVRNHYHSTVVAAMAGTLAVARQLDPHRR
jgi:hypothetical protein